jgi:hypothetical protein
MIKILPSRLVNFATEDDIQCILRLWDAEMNYLHSVDPVFFNSTDSDRQDFQERLEITFDMYPVFILRISGKIEGFATINYVDIGFTDINRIPYCEIEYLIVSRKFALGNRKILLDEVKLWAKKRGCQRIDIKVYSKDEKILSYYNKIKIQPTYNMMSVDLSQTP